MRWLIRAESPGQVALALLVQETRQENGGPGATEGDREVKNSSLILGIVKPHPVQKKNHRVKEKPSHFKYLCVVGYTA